MQLPNLLPKWLRAKGAEAEESAPVSDRAGEPEGSAPKNLITRIAILLGVALMAVILLLAPDEPATNAPAPVAAPLPPPGGPAAVATGERGIDEAEDRRRIEQSQREQARQEAAERARQTELLWRQQEEEAAALAAGGGGAEGSGGQQELTPEQELRQSIRLEKIQRRHSSLRADPVALSFRSSEPAPAAAPQPVPAPSIPQPVETPVPQPVAEQAQPEPSTPAEQALVEGGVVAAEARPRDPRGWERIDGGQWIEAVLVTQIRGDAPGPAIALVSTPFWSRDRQRILIPRGARFVGRAQAVTNWEQARLTVTFDRLIFDGYNLRLPFAGLSQAGEAGLKDQVNRHYLQTFGAAGAVGVIAGLTLRNTQSVGFNVPAGQAARMEAGRSLGESASAIMNRFLNRLPTITIRAGHRIRIYFTSDLLVPRRPA